MMCAVNSSEQAKKSSRIEVSINPFNHTILYEIIPEEGKPVECLIDITQMEAWIRMQRIMKSQLMVLIEDDDDDDDGEGTVA